MHTHNQKSVSSIFNCLKKSFALYYTVIITLFLLSLNKFSFAGNDASYTTILSIIKNNAAADGLDKNTVVVKVLDASNNPVAGQTVVFSITRGVADFSSYSTVITNSSGDAQISLTSITAGNVIINAQVNGDALTSGSPISLDFTAGPPSTSNPLTRIIVVVNNQPADGSSKNVVQVHVVDANNNPAANQDVSFTVTISGSASGGVSYVIRTDDNGDAMLPLSSTAFGDVSVTAKVNGANISYGSPATLHFTAGPPDVNNALTTLVVTRNSQIADGTSTDIITATVVDANGHPVKGATVVFAKASGSGFFTTSATVTTDATGKASVYMSSFVLGNNFISATVNGASIIHNTTVNAYFRAGAPDVSNALTTIKVTQDNATANGTAKDKIMVHVADANGNSVVNAIVVFTQTGGSGILDSTTVKTNGNGDAVIGMSSIVAGKNYITATVNGITVIHGSAAVATFVADAPSVTNQLTTISVVKNNSIANGTATDQVKVHVVDANINPVPNAVVEFTKTSGSASFVGSTTISTDANGDAFINMTSTVAGQNQVIATVNATPIVNGSPAKPSFIADEPSVTNTLTKITVTQNNAIANGTATDLIVVHVADANGNNVPNAIVVFTKTSGSGNFTSSQTAKTDGNGNDIITMVSNVSGSNSITATVNGIAITNGSPATATFVADAPDVSASTTKISVIKNDAVADGADNDKVTVHVTDANGNAISGALVEFSKNGNANFTSTTTVITDNNGDATISLTSTTSGITNVTAKVNGQPVVNGSPAKANFKAGAAVVNNPNTKIIIVKDSAYADGKDANIIKVHAVDANGNPVAGQTVVFTKVDGNGNFAGATNVITDEHGDALISITSNVSGVVKISAIINGLPIVNNSPVIIAFRSAIDFNDLATAITVIKDSAIADNISINILNVHLVDKSGKPVEGVQVDYSILSGTATPVTPLSVITNVKGDALISFSSNIANEVAIIAKVLNTEIINGSPAKIHFLLPSTDIVVPKIFTPNNDGINDILKPIVSSITELRTFNIYNRWGNLMFSTKDTNSGWDGTLKGVPQPVETYLWFAEGVDKDGKLIKRKGMVTLAR